MKRLHKLVIMSFLGPFIMTFFIVLFLLLMQFLWRYINELVGKGLGLDIIGELLLYASSGLVPLALPLAILLSSLMTFGNMGEFYELTAIKASGISLRRIMMPIVYIVVIVSFGAFVFSNNVLPVTNLKMKSLLFDVRQTNPEVSITEGVFYNGLDNYSIRINKKDPVTNLLYDIKIYDHSGNKGNVDVTVADSGRMKMTADRRNMIITLWNGYKYTEVDEGRRRKDRNYPHRMLKFGEQSIIIEMTGFELSRTDASIFKNSYQMLNVTQLARAGDSLKRDLRSKSQEFYNTLIKSNYFKLTKATKRSVSSSGSPVYSNTPNIPLAAGGRMAVAEDLVAARKAAAIRKVGQPRADLGNELRNQADTMVVADNDSIKKPPKMLENFDSLYAAYSLQDKQMLIRSATNFISMTQYLVVNASSNLEYQTRLLRRHEIEWHRKFTLAFACLIFMFIGVPLGAIIRKGGLGLPTVISTLLFILYYIISLTGEKFVRESVLSSFTGMWLSSFVLIIAGIFLTYQATNDAAILNIDTYVNWVREKAGLRKGILLDKKVHVAGRFELVEIPRAKLQTEFNLLSTMAASCLESLKNDSGWLTLARKSFSNTGFLYLIEFGVHYNSFIDQTLLSKWYRIPYFQKRLTEFPFIDGKITSEIFTKRIPIWISVIVFPIGLLRLIHLKLKVLYLRRSLNQAMELSAGMVNLLNSSAIRTEDEIL